MAITPHPPLYVPFHIRPKPSARPSSLQRLPTPTSAPPPSLQRTSTGILSTRRPPTHARPLSDSDSDTYPAPASALVPAQRLGLLATAKRDAARRTLYARFFRGPVLGPADAQPAPTPTTPSMADQLAGKPPDVIDALAHAHLVKKKRVAVEVEVEVEGKTRQSKEDREERRRAKEARRATKEARRATKEARRAAVVASADAVCEDEEASGKEKKKKRVQVEDVPDGASDAKRRKKRRKEEDGEPERSTKVRSVPAEHETTTTMDINIVDTQSSVPAASKQSKKKKKRKHASSD
jgi:hypothetical protein